MLHILSLDDDSNENIEANDWLQVIFLRLVWGFIEFLKLLKDHCLDFHIYKPKVSTLKIRMFFFKIIRSMHRTGCKWDNACQYTWKSFGWFDFLPFQFVFYLFVG